MRIVLTHEKKLYVLDEPIPEAPPAGDSAALRNAHTRLVNDSVETLYEEQTRHERFDVSKALFSTKLSEESPVGPHLVKMIGYSENLTRLEFVLEQELVVDLFLQALPKSFNSFVQNFLMNDMDKTLPQLAAMLRTTEKNMKGKRPF
ncbi:uncharacterized protein [Medicago truncatula]|uniref:uncharacterized protein n=1 Tax=Medicago truncatula TaxID=3880 RepID=UPI000D2F213E|nr:uncharacterized protein LOC112417373 [Medicago truncatula]